MTGIEIVIKFKKDRVFITEDNSLSFKQLGLNNFESSKTPIAHWRAKIISYIPNEKRLFVKVLHYGTGDYSFYGNQIELSDKLNKVEKISFRHIETFGLLRTLRSSKVIANDSSKLDFHDNEGYVSKKKVLSKRNINETFFVPIKKIRFKFGGVSFEKKFKGYSKILELEILNDEIREEFDAVKNYFANVLKTKKIQVIAKIEIFGNKIISREINSPEINRINSELIENVKLDFVKETKKKSIKVVVDKTLFTMDEYFDTFADEKFESNTFHKNDKELVEDLLLITKSKHYKNLRYLSSKHSHSTMKLRFILKPFSFLFLIKGEKNYHIIWETLDTKEATYVWHTQKDIGILRKEFSKIEDTINTIQVQGKIAYLNTANDSFQRIYHDYSNLNEGFIRWKSELENILT